MLGVIDARGPTNSMPRSRNWPAAWPGRCTNCATSLLHVAGRTGSGARFCRGRHRIHFRRRVGRAAASIGRGDSTASPSKWRRGSPATRRMQVVLVGPPNVGKSSLFNALVERFGVANSAGSPPRSCPASAARRATISPRRSTLGGVRCELVDTAGIDRTVLRATRDRGGGPEPCRVERRKRAIDPCVLRRCVRTERRGSRSTESRYCRADESGSRAAAGGTTRDSTVRRADRRHQQRHRRRASTNCAACCAALLVARPPRQSRGSCVAATADRCRESVRLADAAVARAAEIAADRGGDELVAAEIRVALAELGKVVGTVYTDDLLDRIFRTFCIGK